MRKFGIKLGTKMGNKKLSLKLGTKMVFKIGIPKLAVKWEPQNEEPKIGSHFELGDSRNDILVKWGIFYLFTFYGSRKK